MPVAIPLLAAAGTAMAGYAAVATGVTLASQVIGGVMMAGAAMTAVGAVTGNQRLTKLGAVASLAGGVSGIMSGAWEGAASLAAQNAATDSAMMDLAGNAAQTASAAAPEAGMLSAQEFAGLQGPSGGGVAPSVQALPPTPAAAPVAGAATPGAVQPSAAAPTTVTGVPNVAATVPNPSAGLTSNAAVPATQLGSSGGGILDSVKNGIKWMTATPENARISQGLMGMVASAGAAYSQQEAIKEQLAQQEAVRQRAIDRLNASVKGVKVAPTYVRPGG